MRTLVLVEDYPSNAKPYAMSYVHTRCLEYLRRGVQFDVLSFSVKQAYNYQGVSVLPSRQADFDNYDTILSHAPNLRNHCRVLARVRNKRLVLFFHGHECLRTIGDYPDPYSWAKGRFSRRMSSAYDRIKLPALRLFLRLFSRRNHLRLVFVSDWMKRMFEKNLLIEARTLGETAVIPNACNRAFVQQSYTSQPGADFITIRPLDESKYALDLVMALAEANKELTFHVYGRGKFFDHVRRPPNVTHFPFFVPQEEIPGLLNRYKAAVMPTRFDAQGVMMCEMASYGIPVVTTDIEITREMLSSFDNARLWNEGRFFERVKPDDLAQSTRKNPANPFCSDVLIQRELDFIHA